MKIKAIAASTFFDFDNQYNFSKSALKELAETAANLPLYLNQEKIGVVESGSLLDEKLIITAKVENKDKVNDKGLYLAPGGLTDYETNGDMLQRCKAHRYTLTDSPNDKTLTPFEEVEP